MDTGAILVSNDTQIHAVKYWPEPVGYQEVFADRSRDPYNHNYQDSCLSANTLFLQQECANTLSLVALRLERLVEFCA